MYAVVGTYVFFSDESLFTCLSTRDINTLNNTLNSSSGLTYTMPGF